MKTIQELKGFTPEKIGYKRQGVAYNLSPNKWIELFNLIEETGNISLIARTYEIKRPTLSKKYRAWKNNYEDPSIDKRAYSSRFFSKADEDMMMSILWDQAVVVGSYKAFSDNNIRDVATQLYDSLKRKKPMKPFVLSSLWASDFKRRHGITLNSTGFKYHLWNMVC